MKKAFRYFFITIIFIVFISLISFVSLCSNTIFKHITLPLINSFIPVKISVEKWAFRPWKSVRTKGLIVSDISEKNNITNFYLSADSLNLNYKISTFFSGVPFFSLVEAEGVDYIASDYKKAARKKKKSKSAPSKKTHSDNKHAFALYDFPVNIKKLIVRNFSFNYSDNKNSSFGVTGFNFAGINIGPESSGSALANGSFFYSDGSHVFMDFLPFAWDMNYIIKKSIVPDLFSSTLLSSNVVGRAGRIDLSPLTAEINISALKEDNVLNFSKCLFESYWNGDKISVLSVTGKLDFTKSVINCQAGIDIWSNDLYQVLVRSYKRYDISQSHVNSILNFNADIDSDKYKVDGKIVLKKVYAKKNKKLPPLNFAGIFNIAFDNKAKLLKLNKVNFIIEDPKHPMVQLKTAAPISLNINNTNKNAISTNKSSKISLVVNKVNFKYLNNFTEQKNIAFHSGEISGKIVCDVLGVGEKININSSVIADKMSFSINKSKWEDLDIKLGVDGSIKKLNALSLSRFNTTFFINKKKYGEIAAGGVYNIRSGKEKVAIAATDFSGMLLSPLFSGKEAKKKFNDLILNLKLLSEKPKGATKRALSINLNVNNPKRLTEDELEKISLDINANINPNKIIFNNCELLVLPGKWDDNTLKLTGKINLKENEKQSDLNLHSKHFDATALLNTFLPLTKFEPEKKIKKKYKKSKKTTKKTEKVAFKEPVPPKFHFLNVNFKTHIDEFIIRKMIVAPLSFDLVMKNNKINFLTHDIMINGGNFDTEVQADLSVTGFIYSSNLKMDQIPLSPILKTWAKEIGDKIAGTLDGKLSLSGKGFSTTNIIKHFKGKAKLSLSDGHLENVPLLNSLSEKLNIDDLEDFYFDKFMIKVTSINGTNFIDKFEIDGKKMKMGIEGYTTINNDLDLDLSLALSGKMIKQIFSNQKSKFNIPFTGDVNKFYELPMPIKIGGTIMNPSIESNSEEFVPMLIQLIGPDVIKSVGKLFSKDKKESKKAKKEGIELLKGLWEQLKEQPAEPSQKKHNLPHRTK